jgi:hypothetical protein
MTAKEVFTSELPDWPAALRDLKARNSGLIRWEARIVPVPLPKHIDGQVLRNAIATDRAQGRGWDFPAYDHESAKFFNGYFAQATKFQHMDEFWQISNRGVFGATGVFWLDKVPQSGTFNHPAPPERVVDFKAIVEMVTEYFLVASRLAATLKFPKVVVSYGLYDIKGRSLGSVDILRRMLPGKTAVSSEVVIEDELTPKELLGYADLGLQWSKRIFTVFQWPDADVAVIQKIQDEMKTVR